jgi:hypothetical protein
MSCCLSALKSALSSVGPSTRLDRGHTRGQDSHSCTPLIYRTHRWCPGIRPGQGKWHGDRFYLSRLARSLQSTRTTPGQVSTLSFPNIQRIRSHLRCNALQHTSRTQSDQCWDCVQQHMACTQSHWPTLCPLDIGHKLSDQPSCVSRQGTGHTGQGRQPTQARTECSQIANLLCGETAPRESSHQRTERTRCRDS